MPQAIGVKNLSVWYNIGGAPAIKDVNLSIDEGEFVLLVGRTGSGKSTLLNSINGVIPNVINAKVEGSVKVFGKDTQKSQLKDLSTLIGTVYQTPEDQIFSLVVEDDVAFGPENLALPPSEIRERVDQAIELVGLGEKKKFPTFLLSGGQKQRLVIADALAMRPKILVLDEPTSMLDSLGTSEVFSTLKKLRDDFGMTIIMAEHKVERVLGLVDRLILIDNKTIAIDKPIREALLEDLNKYGIEEPQVSYLYKLLGGGKSAPLTVNEFLDYEKGFANSLKGAQLPISDPIAPMGDKAVEFDDVWFMYERSKDWIFKGISFSVNFGEFVSLVGPNGSGKTTALRLIAGLQKPNKGEIRLLGRPSSSMGRKALSALVGYVFQDPDQMLFNTTVLSEVMFTPRLLGYSSEEAKRRAMEMLSIFGLKAYAGENPHRLSVGQRRLLSLASVLVNEPKILLLDEPTRGLDWETGEEVMNFVKRLVKERGMAAIAVSHNMKQAADHSDRVIAFYSGGVVADGSPRQVFASAMEHPEWSLVPPQVFQLTYALGLRPPAVRVSELIPLLKANWRVAGRRAAGARLRKDESSLLALAGGSARTLG
ncbi:MAG: energy-coupling factor transporter ATPase [Candidatus Marsarchaeota archaeon]